MVAANQYRYVCPYPETYVADLDVRMALYRRLGDVQSEEEIDAFAAELVDRFGSMPKEVEHLLRDRCDQGGLPSRGDCEIDAGPKGAVVGFRNDQFVNPAGLIELSQALPTT